MSEKREKLKSVISDEVKEIRTKLEASERLTSKEKKLEVSRDEAAYILSAVAGRMIEPAYIKQLIRTDKGNPRLVPARAIGDTYLYTVGSLLEVRFTKTHGGREADQEAELMS